MDLHQLSIACPSGEGRETKVTLNGEPIEQGLTGVVLRINTTDLVTAELELLFLATEFEGQASVVLPEETRQVLEQLGWIPPETS